MTVTWRVKFELVEIDPSGAVTQRSIISEGNFENRGQAEAWYASGSRKRFGPEFWSKVRSITVEPSDYVSIAAETPPPPFTGGGATRDGDTVIEATCWYTRTED